MDRPALQTLQQRLERIEQSIERWRRKPASRRQRLILAGYRRAASELRRQSLDNYPTSSQHRVFHVIRNPANGSRSGERRLTRASLRVVKR